MVLGAAWVGMKSRVSLSGGRFFFGDVIYYSHGEVATKSRLGQIRVDLPPSSQKSIHMSDR